MTEILPLLNGEMVRQDDTSGEYRIPRRALLNLHRVEEDLVWAELRALCTARNLDLTFQHTVDFETDEVVIRWFPTPKENDGQQEENPGELSEDEGAGTGTAELQAEA